MESFFPSWNHFSPQILDVRCKKCAESLTVWGFESYSIKLRQIKCDYGMLRSTIKCKDAFRKLLPPWTPFYVLCKNPTSGVDSCHKISAQIFEDHVLPHLSAHMFYELPADAALGHVSRLFTTQSHHRRLTDEDRRQVRSTPPAFMCFLNMCIKTLSRNRRSHLSSV